MEKSSYFSIGRTVVLFRDHSSGTNFHKLWQSCPKNFRLPLSQLFYSLNFSNFQLSKVLKLILYRHDSYSNLELNVMCRSLWNFAFFCTFTHRSPSITSRTLLFTAPLFQNDGLPSRTSSITFSLLSENLMGHLNTRERLTFLYFCDCFRNYWVSVGVHSIRCRMMRYADIMTLHT